MNSQDDEESNMTKERKLLVKFGSILKKRIVRWYRLNSEKNAIEYYKDKNSPRLKGRIDVASIAVIRMSSETTEKYILQRKSNERSITVWLSSAKIVYLFEKDKASAESLMRLLFKLMAKTNKSQMNLSTKILTVSKQQRILEQQPLKDIQTTNPQADHLDLSDVNALMPESASQRAIQSPKGSFSVISDCGGECVPPISDETSKRIPHLTKNGQQRKHNAETVENILPVVSNIVKVNQQQDDDSEVEFERYVKYNEEIREALSKEETENTIRARVFSKYQSSNEPFQIAKIKRQIYSSSQSLTKSQAQKDSSFAINNNNNNNNNNPFNFVTLSSLNYPRNANTSIDQNKFGFTLPSPQLASPQHASAVFSPRILETNSPTLLRQSDENDISIKKNNQDPQKAMDVSLHTQNASPAPHYETQETPHQTATLRKFDEAEFSIQADTYHNLTSNTKYNRKEGFTSAKNSISDIETESNLASIKQFQGDMLGKHSLQDTFTQELRGYFKAQTYFYQEFNTLMSLNTQYLGGTNPTANNKKNTIVSSNNANYNPSNTLNHSTKQKEGYQTTLFNLTSIPTDGMISEKQRKKIQGDIEVTARNMKIYEVPSENSICSFSDEQEIFSEKEIDRLARLVESYSHSGRMVNCFKSKVPEIKLQQIQQHNSSNNLKNGKKMIHPRIEQVPIERYQLGKLLSDGFVLLEPESRVIIDSSDDVSRVEEQMKFMEVATRSVKMKSEPDFLAANPQAKVSLSPQQIIRSPSVGLNRRNSSFQLDNPNNNNNINNSNNNNNNTVTNNNNNNLNASFGNNNNDASAFSPSFSSQQRQCSPAMSSPDGHKLWPEENEDDFQNLDNSPNISTGKSLQLGMNFLWDFKFQNAQAALDQSRGAQDADIILGQIYILLVQFFFSLRTELLENIIKLCEHGVDVTLALRARKNIFLFLAQDAYLAEIYLIKGIILFALDKKIQSLLSFKNAYKYFERCLSAAPEVSSLLTFYHKSKIDLLEGLYNIAACTLQESYRKVLLFFGQKFDSQRGLQILSLIANKQYSNAQSCPHHLTQQLTEYMRSFHDKANVDVASHIATCSLALYHIWREKNAIPVAKLISTQLKQYSSSPIYLWLSYLVNFERKDNVKALGQLNKALLKCHTFRPQNIAFKFEKAGFLASNMLWRESSVLFGCIVVQLLSFDGFKTEQFKSMLQKQVLSGTSAFSAFYRSKQLEFKSEKIFFTGISNVLLSYAATLIGIGDIPQAKECLLLSPYFKKYSYLSGFINQDMHQLSLIFIKRRNFNLVKFEIMYFTKIITKVPLELIKNMLQEVESHREILFSQQQKTMTPSEAKSLAVEQASYILLRILAGCLQCDSQIIQECEVQLGTIVNFTADKKLAENAYLLHHSYYWISKFYLLSSCYASALSNLKNMVKYPTKIFSLQPQADGILKDIEAHSPNAR